MESWRSTEAMWLEQSVQEVVKGQTPQGQGAQWRSGLDFEGHGEPLQRAVNVRFAFESLLLFTVM